ncbi:MAG: MFS transporter, partial [Eubacteriales bacterium]|nr:MFS transporter [Eubacteriales bacterium]
AAIYGVTNIVAGLNVGTYYFAYVVKNIEISGALGALGILAMVSMLFFPALLKKMSTAQLIRRTLALSIVSGILGFIAKDNILILACAGIVSGLVALPTSYLGNILIVECADYNEWKGMRRMEGTISSVTNFAMKVGQALGVLLTGAFLSAAGFDGALTEQSGSAVLMIRLLYSIIPMVIYLAGAFALRFYKLDKMKPQMDAELAERRAQAQE